MFAEHHYGESVRILSGAYTDSLLARIRSPESDGPALLQLTRLAYEHLLSAVFNEHLPTETVAVPTRMYPKDSRGIAQCRRFQPDTKVVICTIVRGGVIPALSCFESACQVMPPANIRQDYIGAARVSSAGSGVEGVSLEGIKIGGSVAETLLVIPDPMGATGSTIERVLQEYEQHHGLQSALGVAVIHLIVAPEAIQRLRERYPRVQLWALSVDRGASAPPVQQTVPGMDPENERGLNNDHYILPGAGGLGEVMTNANA